MKLFKEWFKAPEDTGSMTKQEQSVKHAAAQQEAHALEKIARMNLRGKNEEYLDAMDPEFQLWLVNKYPKTNDDSLASDYDTHLS